MADIVKNPTKEEKIHSKKKVAKITTKDIVSTGMFAALLGILSQITFPLPSGVPVTMQTFAVALTAFVLAWKLGMSSVLVYILMGAVGIPVFSGFIGGIQVLVNYTGGFIWGFVIMALLCGIATLQNNKIVVALLSLAGLAVCHIFGVLQFMAVMKMGLVEAFGLASAPYIIKDVISVVLAYVIGSQIRKRLLKAGLM